EWTPPEAPFILLATGGRGVFFDLSKVLHSLRVGLPDLPVYVMCGRNEKMLEVVQSVAKQDCKVYGLPFIQQVAQWFQRAAFAVIKSGGLTVAECLACACPMLLYRPAPGQEMDNARLMSKLGAGVLVEHPRDLPQVLTSFANEHVLREMAKVCQTVAKPDAARQIVDTVLTKLSLLPKDPQDEV
ncbi:hypothetical protein D2Q93_13595, partial [Alicyclobacillaceae bacterium I2511]